jgi:hypothetical protein
LINHDNISQQLTYKVWRFERRPRETGIDPFK